MGYQSEPATQGFVLTVGDGVSIPFDLTRETTVWTDKSKKNTLTYEPTWREGVDTAGFFRLTLDRSVVTPGQSLTITVASLGEGSQRWFAIHPITHPVLHLTD